MSFPVWTDKQTAERLAATVRDADVKAAWDRFVTYCDPPNWERYETEKAVHWEIYRKRVLQASE